jgi:hypothetical protein
LSGKRKDRLAQIRISSEDDELIKKYGATKAEIFRIGLDEWLKRIPEKMKEQAEYHSKMSLQCNDNLKEINIIQMTNKTLLDTNCLEYIRLGRSIPEDITMLPHLDKSWIEARIKNKKLSCDVHTFIARCKELKDSLTNTQDSSS